MLQYRKRIAASPWQRHVKSLVSPLGCAAVTNHICATAIHEYKPDLPPVYRKVASSETLAIGHNQHYRHDACYLTIYGVRCRDGANGTVVYQDDNMLRFAEKLKARVSKRLGTNSY